MPRDTDSSCNDPQICNFDSRAPRDCNNDPEELDFSWSGGSALSSIASSNDKDCRGYGRSLLHQDSPPPRLLKYSMGCYSIVSIKFRPQNTGCGSDDCSERNL